MKNAMALEERRPNVHALEIMTKIIATATKVTLNIIFQM
jgi:hypothetical protein